MFDFPWSRHRLYLQTGSEDKTPQFSPTKKNPLDSLQYSCTRSLILAFTHSSNTGTLPDIPPGTTGNPARTPNGAEGVWISTDTWRKLTELYYERGQKCPYCLDEYFVICFPLSKETWCLNVIWSKYQVFSYMRGTSLHLPPVHLFPDFYLAAFE